MTIDDIIGLDGSTLEKVLRELKKSIAWGLANIVCQIAAFICFLKHHADISYFLAIAGMFAMMISLERKAKSDEIGWKAKASD